MDPDVSNKPAWLTTEFWLTIIPTALLLIKALTGKDTSGVDVNSLALIAVGIMTAGYAISRALTKKAVTQAKALIANQRMAIQHDTAQQRIARQHDADMQSSRYASAVSDEHLLPILQRVSALEEKVSKPARPAGSRAARVARAKG